MRYAAVYKPDSEPLDQFIRRRGGINACASRDPMKSRLPGPRQQPVHHHLTWIAATAWKLMLLHRLRGEVCRLILTLPLVARKGHPFPNGLPSNLLSFHLVALSSRKSPLISTRRSMAVRRC
jgi:hypothetical protein